jgi:hypothetical protein
MVTAASLLAAFLLIVAAGVTLTAIYDLAERRTR